MVASTPKNSTIRQPLIRGEYEEYHPYGSTAWWAEKSGIQVSRKRYRYTGMERDEETGMAYHHHRYYLPWLGRWASADPAGLVDGGNRFAYARGNPIRGRDQRGTDTEDTVEAPPVLPDGIKATTREEALQRGHARVREANEKNQRRLTDSRGAQRTLEGVGVDEPGKGSVMRNISETWDQTPRALRTLEKLGLNTDFFLVGVGVGEQAPDRTGKEVTGSNKGRTVGTTDPHTGDIHLYAGSDWTTAIHESVHAYAKVVSMPRSLERSLSREVIKGIAGDKGISRREARAEFDALGETKQASILSEVMAYSVGDRVAAMDDFASASGDRERQVKAAEDYARPVDVRSGDFSVKVPLSRHSTARIDRYLGIDMPRRLQGNP